MKAFEYYKVASVAQAISLLSKHEGKAALLAGGSDLFGLMKDRLEGPKLRTPQFLIDIKGIKELNAIKEEKKRLTIGATVTLSEILSSDLIIKKYPLLAQAASQVAVPQIRNVGTLGGNLCQRPRCWYFRRSLFKDCLRKGGNTCYAPNGENQYHAIMGNSGCCMVHPSDMATALIALQGRAVIATAKGHKTLPMEQFYVRPDKNVLKENVLNPQEMLVAVEIPEPASGTKGVYLKVKERQAFDFAIASVAVNLAFKSSAIADSRIVLGGIAPLPFRSIKAESVLKGKGLNESISSVCNAALDGAEPLSQNGYKIETAKGILEEALGRLV